MPADETPLSFEQPRSAFGTWLGVVLLFVVFALFVWVVMRIMPRGDQYEEKRAAARVEKLKTATDEANATLHSYGWVDKEKGLAHVPIERAMQLATAELAQKMPAPAGPIASPAAAPQPGAQTTTPAAPSAAPMAPPQPAPGSSPAITTTEGPGSEINNQPAGAANPRNAAPATQPGPSATPATLPAPSEVAPAPPSERGPTPMQSAPGTPLPVRPEHP
jgi:hypothetical protein